MMKKKFVLIGVVLSLVGAQAQVKLTLDLAHPGHAVSRSLYGLMTEEINYSYEGGLYGELVRNRNFRASEDKPVFWYLVQGEDDKAAMALDKTGGQTALRLEVEKAGAKTGIANEGYWGFPVTPNTVYHGRLIEKGAGGLTVTLESNDGRTVYASTVITGGADWGQYPFTLQTVGDAVPTADAKLAISVKNAGVYWFSLVSLFPPTYKGRANGNRKDIMQLLADMKPQFLRFPGGNYLEGGSFSNRFDWKKTIGPAELRPGHMSPWGYYSTDGMGLLEFLEWCGDLHMEPLPAVFAGFVLDKDYLEAGPFLQPFVNDALDEIEYISGDTTTAWGARRAKDGHPAPFPLHYVEIGNEDGFDYSGSYRERYVQFYDAIKAKYPNLRVIATAGGKDPLSAGVPPPPAGKLEVVDEHYYRTASEMEENAAQFDGYDRSGPKVFVGEWATREGSPTPNFNAALGDAAWMTGMERNSDLVIMSCYAPLFVNVNPGGMQWRSDLIGYNTLSSYGSPSYYAQQMFSNHVGNRVVPVAAENLPWQWQKLTRRDSAQGNLQPKKIDAFFYVATMDTASGKLFLKLVNTQPAAQPLDVVLGGAGKVSREGRQWVLQADSPTATNSIDDPEHIVPVESTVKGLGAKFSRVLPPYSITVMEINIK